MMKNLPHTAPPAPEGEEAVDRRAFLKKAACATLGGCALLAPVAFGTVVFIDPLLARKKSGVTVRLATLEDLPLEGPPKLYQVLAEPVDAWTKFPQKPVGSVFLQRVGEREVRAFNALCPHVGGSITFREAEGDFFCPLHESRFDLDGSLTSRETPSPRGMDSLEVEVRDEEVWVNFRNFAPNTPEKIPV